MSVMAKVLIEISKAESRSAVEIAEAIDIDVRKVRTAINYMQKVGHIASKPVAYEITEAGMATVEKKARRKPPEPKQQTTTDYAIRKVPNSVWQLGVCQ